MPLITAAAAAAFTAPLAAICYTILHPLVLVNCMSSVPRLGRGCGYILDVLKSATPNAVYSRSSVAFLKIQP